MESFFRFDSSSLACAFKQCSIFSKLLVSGFFCRQPDAAVPHSFWFGCMAWTGISKLFPGKTIPRLLSGNWTDKRLHFFGRFFCLYVCSGGILSEIMEWNNRLGTSLFNRTDSDGIKFRSGLFAASGNFENSSIILVVLWHEVACTFA